MASEETASPAAGDEDRRRRARYLAEVFGDVLPETTADERGPVPREDRDDWYRWNRPPHHDS
ncbi:hypothetical protein CDG81_03435 [Actinopolyspora erythraea]|uniref:Uncharacterized protein n=1 Tax=Actinopolyspora erythraea TaxID=414996 RepID=A0A099D392_9ACTN|nr:hypothetical protein [Actinopolyspora erythraea]ASU77515.1 hypothetical protein CDG81_03435 [Actinopolyspora erythraea]KGI80489.1 hypothetical protein IL38_17550 [Actinopolyspora erythraea]